MRINRKTFQDEFNVSRETMEKLERYEALLVKWNKKINLVSSSTIGDLWHRHFADSAQLWGLAPGSASLWLDFGSGAGFPGLVCAILAEGDDADLKVVLVESDQRKAAFLMTVARDLDLHVSVISKRIENAEIMRSDVITARAVAALPLLLQYAEPHRRDSTVLLFPKGNTYESELTAATKNWHIDVEAFKSITDFGSVILKMKGSKRVK